eukprot:g4547.t1
MKMRIQGIARFSQFSHPITFQFQGLSKVSAMSTEILKSLDFSHGQAGVLVATFLTVIPLAAVAVLSQALGERKLFVAKVLGFFCCFGFVKVVHSVLGSQQEVGAVGLCVFLSWSLFAAVMAALGNHRGYNVKDFIRVLGVSRVLLLLLFSNFGVATPLYMSCVVGTLQMLDTPLRKILEDWGLPPTSKKH